MLKTARIFFFFNLVFAPLAFGPVETWSLTIMEAPCLAGLLLYAGAATPLGLLDWYEYPF